MKSAPPRYLSLAVERFEPRREPILSKAWGSFSSFLACNCGRCPFDAGELERAYVVLVDILVGVVLEQQRSDDAYDAATENIKSDRVTRVICREQCRRNERRRTSGDDRGELIAYPCTAVTQPRVERFG